MNIEELKRLALDSKAWYDAGAVINDPYDTYPNELFDAAVDETVVLNLISQIERLKAEANKWRNEMLKINTYAEFMAEAERLDPEGFAKARADRAEADALREDAERYRWLREAHDSADNVALWHVRGTAGQPIEAGALDAQIDEAMWQDAKVSGLSTRPPG